jgi:hypothetical protein
MPGQFQYKELRTFRPFAQSALYENANVPSQVRYGQRPSLASRLGKPYVDEADSWPVIPGRSQEDGACGWKITLEAVRCYSAMSE